MADIEVTNDSFESSSIAEPEIERGFGTVGNRHLYDWISENEIHLSQLHSVMMEVDGNIASKQPKVNSRKEFVSELLDEFERTMQSRSNNLEAENYLTKQQNSGLWTEDFRSNETDPFIKLQKYDEMVTKSEEVMTET